MLYYMIVTLIYGQVKGKLRRYSPMTFKHSERLTFSVKEAAQLLGLSKNSAYQGILTGEIPHIKIGKRILIPRNALERFLNGYENEAKP
jgi:excisionase family DNA binding protein